MESIWLVCCAESAYGRVRAEVRKRDVRARIARVNSVEGAVQLGGRVPRQMSMWCLAAIPRRSRRRWRGWRSYGNRLMGSRYS